MRACWEVYIRLTFININVNFTLEWNNCQTSRLLLTNHLPPARLALLVAQALDLTVKVSTFWVVIYCHIVFCSCLMTQERPACRMPISSVIGPSHNLGMPGELYNCNPRSQEWCFAQPTNSSYLVKGPCRGISTASQNFAIDLHTESWTADLGKFNNAHQSLGWYHHVTGIETAGLVLAIFLLVMQGMKVYANAARAIKMWNSIK